MEPWLDGLSEEWNSEPRSSSPPAARTSSQIHGTNNGSRRVPSTSSQSRIPHLAANIRHNSLNSSTNHGSVNGFGTSTGSFLKPRSTRGIARMKEQNQNAGNALTERTPSSLNALPSSPVDLSKKQTPLRSPSHIPRRASSGFSNKSANDSQASVVQHSISKSVREQETPEWKRKLRDATDPMSDGFDLFSPSKLEGIFKQSSGPVEHNEECENDENDGSILVTEMKPWNSLDASASAFAFPPPGGSLNGSDRHSTSRTGTTKSRLPEMGTLREEDEHEDGYEDQSKTFDLSAISSDIVRESDIRGIVQRRVSNLELERSTNPLPRQQGSWRSGQDPRMRTISGRKEISNELISPVSDHERSSIRKQALQATLASDPSELRRKLREARRTSRQRSRSRSSDHDISYDGAALNDKDESVLPEDPELMVEMTSQSLPEDLSMGTQNYQSSILIQPTAKRLPSRLESSIMRKPTNVDLSALNGRSRFQSSPPPYKNNKDKDVEESNLSMSAPDSLVDADTSVVHHVPVSTQHSTAGSPLKLFGPRDTYTSNKLLRVLSQFEEDQSDQSELQVPEPKPDEAAALRMSNFGKGELDGFDFDKQVERPTVNETEIREQADKVFKNLASLDIAKRTEVDDTTGHPSVKERSPKRRRTLLRNEVGVDGTNVEIKISQVAEGALAGKKRRDALPGKEAEPASPETLATRRIVRPSGSRKSSATSHSRAASTSDALQIAANAAPELAEQLAAELESFAQGVVNIKQDSRKPSLATKDYMEEANKVMEFIRARGKPKASLPEIQEPEEVSELDPDKILDLEVDDSTKDSFSRPPSREGRPLPRVDRRHAQHDAKMASHLGKYREQDDLDLLTSTSALGTLNLVDHKAVEEAALVPVPEDPEFEESMQSDPPGMRILNENANDRKRKHSGSDAEGQNSQEIHSDGSRRTIVTASSTSSGLRGMISQGTISIPDTVGIMTYDKQKKTWVKQKVKTPKLLPPAASSESRICRQEFSEADPFDGIPDLSIDEQKEASWKKMPSPTRKQEEIEHDDSGIGESEDSDMQQKQQEAEAGKQKTVSSPKSSLRSPRRLRQFQTGERPQSKDAEASKHEERLHNGEISRDVKKDDKHQPRVVTIAFSSPVASEIPYIRPASFSSAELDEDDPSLLPLDDEGSVLASSPAKPTEQLECEEEEYGTFRRASFMGSHERHEQYRAMTLNRRPVSRIDEENDEEQQDNQELSLIHVKHNELTPMPDRLLSLAKNSTKDKSSILCLTPLSEFTLHQVDKLNHPEDSYVAERVNPKALRQAHGSHALVEDALVKAITDAEPTELFWEQLRRLMLQNSGLGTLHGLKEYCSTLEYLDVTGNRVTQLTDIPVSLRSLNISSNLVNDLTSWTHLHNLQTVNVSGNQLESLECFSGLIHLRHINASNNKIRSIEGVLDSNGLISLDLSDNDIPEADFSSCELTCLERLDLSSNNLVHIKSLECLPKLKNLDVSENLLEKLIVTANKVVPELDSLRVGQNELADIDLTAFPLLRRLNVDGNLLTVIHGLGEAEHLTVLSARDQRVTSGLVNTILNTPHECTELYLSSNALPNNTLSLSQQPNFTLRCLELAACGIQHLPQGFGDTFPNVRVLNLNFNALSDLTSLRGATKLKHLLLAKNRISKMRRTCLTLSRLPALKKIDVRDNPLTVGFYAPATSTSTTTATANKGSEDENEARPCRLPNRTTEEDKKWIGLMDEMTWLRRRAMELLMAQCCVGLEVMDGLVFERDGLLREQGTWERLMGKGVLKKEKDTGEVVCDAVVNQ